MTAATRINHHAIDNCFDPGTISRGKNYFNQQKVLSIKINPNKDQITSVVRGKQNKTYETIIFLDASFSNTVDIDGECSCYVGYNCKHIVATLLEAKAKYAVSPLLLPTVQAPAKHSHTTALDNWFDDFKLSTTTKDDTTSKKTTEFVYILKKDTYKNKIEVTLNVSNILKTGRLGKPRQYSVSSSAYQKHLNPSDEEIIIGLQLLNKKASSFHYSYEALYLTGPQSTKWLKAIINTERAYWERIANQPLSFGEEETLTFGWTLLPDASQALKASINHDVVELLILDDPWYLNKEKGLVGPLQTELPTTTIQSLLKAPNIHYENIALVSEKMKALAPAHPSLLPLDLAEPIRKLNIKPTPILHLDISQSGLPTAELFFNYDGYDVPFSLENKAETITYAENDTLYSIKRNFEQEKEHLVALSKHLNLEETGQASKANTATKLNILSIQDEADFLTFSMVNIPAIEALGWQVERKHGAYLERLEEADVAWYSELEDEAQYDYFGFSMGIMLDGQKINILPLLGNLIRRIRPEDLKKIPDKETIPLPLPEGKMLLVPFLRIKPMINILIELYDTDLNSKGGLNLSKRQASLLYDIEKAFKASKMRWMGGEKLRALGKKLSSFRSIQKITPPKLFAATLRPYQQEGVNWMQFLREYELAGILADDMGLGKTVQTLAHLCIEKHAGRMQKPSLIIAPTSLMVNWRLEAARFTSHLNVLLYHGDNRKQLDTTINDYDLILTTYPLLTRDKKMLLDHTFYYLILDEAQFIKNSKAKSTQIVHQIKADHRLCLTGTPMENHLGELWSLFHFLMPGFLGSEQQFKKLFRTPIEKHNDVGRKKALSQRIKPFMLRRLKNDVLKELPDKTEITRSVELEGPQRDLYESIRLSMEKKVRDAIQTQGLARSHIIVLDALLKLRQTCCDPRLLKLDAAKKAHQHSAKMALLMDMLPEMVEEGRKILLFSQFTGMLEIIEAALNEKKIQYVKLTGSTKNREKPIQAFQEGNTPVFLISLKAGGTGLNLTAADVVIHYDPWWNPAVEDQATDRAHRIGQKKSVFVYKLQAAGTVEETIQQMQERKRSLMTGLFSEKSGEKLTLSGKDLDCLFKPLENIG
ncbi:MAG: DEAD/DEAH box helicase [Legionella sp.]|nr:DEAD/DEAH box helicase [Legionella sp.]